MGSEFDVLCAIACRKGWWTPKAHEDFFKQDCIKYWNEMIEWGENKKAYWRRQKIRRRAGSNEPLNYPPLPRKPIRKF